MGNIRSSRSLLRAAWLLLITFVLALAGSALAQDEKIYDGREPSQAQKEADRLVSLSAERIISILSDEPGLMLQVKKRLVKLAFDQGRLLDEDELTDEALFRLLREDLNMRVLATQEIEQRSYVRPKPTQVEIERERRRRLLEQEELGASNTAPQAQAASATAAGTKQTSQSQEDAYWSRHENDDQLVPAPRGNGTQPQQSQPQAPPTTRSRERDLNRADLENPYEDMTPDTSRMVRARPDDLPDLVAAASARMSSDGDSMAGRPRPQLAPDGRGQNAPTAVDRQRNGDRQQSYPSSSGANSASLSRDNNRLEMQRERTLAEPPSDELRMRHRPNPYANVPALYDLYSQVSQRQPEPQRFGADIFNNGTGNFADLPMDVPVGPEYVLGPGDMVNIELSGSVSQRVQRTVDREGRVALPEVGMVLVAGHSLGDAQREVQAALRTQFREVQADISLARLRMVRVYVVGAVESPGAYDISALSTPLNALYAAGGPTVHGSLRAIRHLRGNKLVEQYDAYDLILRGVRTDTKSLQPGDTIMVPTVGAQVTVEGMVHRPAIYELRGEKSLAEVLELAGGVMSTGTLRHIVLERLEAHQKREMLSLDIPEDNNSQEVTAKLSEFKIQDGDKIRIAPIVAYAEKSIYLDGHLFHPGKYAWKEGMKVSDVIKSYSDLLPEPYLKHAEIIRLNAPNFAPRVIAFNLGDALTHQLQQDLALQPFDTIRIFGRFDFEDTPVITVSGEVREPGDHRTNGAMHVSDAVYLAGGLGSDAQLDEAQLFRKMPDGKVKVLSLNLGKAMAGDEAENLLLQPKDRLVVHKDLGKTDPAMVAVQGEVGKPGKYPLGSGMTVSDLVRAAGGFKRSADTDSADLTRFSYEQGVKTPGEEQRIEIAKAMAGDGTADLPLKDGDVLSIRQLTGWQDRGASITLRGEVVHPGTYGIRPGERLSSVLERAGGLLPSAYPYGAVLARQQVRELEEQSRIEMVRRVEAAGDTLRLMPVDSNTPNHALSKTAAIAQWEATLEKIRTTPPSGRMVIHINSEVQHWANTANDVEMRAGDILNIPKKPSFVMVTGAVFNPNAVSYRPGKSAEWYLSQGGGPTQMAKKHATFVVHADGSIASMGGMWSAGLGGASIRPGDTVVVPERAIGGPSNWQAIFQGAQAFSSIAIATQVLKNF